MQVQLKQADVEQAIKNYIAAVGITREVTEINFTMGRKSSGLVADIEVSDTDNRIYPGGGLCHAIEMPAPTEKAAVSAAAIDDTDEKVPESVEDTPPFDTEPANEETEEAATESGKASLFGNAS